MTRSSASLFCSLVYQLWQYTSAAYGCIMYFCSEAKDVLSLSNPLNIKQTFILIRYLPTRIIVATYKEDIAVIVILPELVKNPTTGCKAAGICVYYLMLLAKHPAGTSAIFPPFPVDLCTDLLYTVCSDNESPMVRIVATWLDKGCRCCVDYVDYQTQTK